MQIVLMGRMAAWCLPEIKRRVAGHHTFTVVADPTTVDQYAAQLTAAEVIVGWPLTQAILDRCPNLKLVQAAGAGVDGMNLESIPAGVQVANTFHHEIAIAEYVLMAMLYLARRPHHYDAGLRSGDWTGSCIWGATPVLPQLYGQTALLIGLGHIAREVATRARAFGVKLVGASRRPEDTPWVDRTVPFSDWEAELPEADWVIPCCPLTPETAGLISDTQFSNMKPTAFLINMTRGRVVNERAAYEALRSGRIAGAALDVWYQYPSSEGESKPPSIYPFHDLPNVLLSPHNSGWTLPTILGRVEDIAENINRADRGISVLNRLR
ncbi:MAG: hydroxyacid dehydrogenase [Acidobacteria bacterium]|nr:hydroxyacid dehydrogenase [Acidobacteriota bacterium]